MVSLIYLSHNEIESVYPITESGEPLPNLKLLGKPIGVRVIESFENEGINDMSVYYSNISSEVYELIGKRVKLEETGKLDFLNSLKNAVENSNSQEIILVLGSFLLNEGFIRELLYKWNEKGSSMLIALVPGSQKLEDLVWKIGVDVEFVEGNVKKAYLIKNNASSFYIFSGIIVSEKEFLLRKIDLSIKDYNQALLKLINETNPPFYIYTGEYVSFASPWSILNAMKMLLQKISGQFISKEAKVSPTAVLEGPVLIEDGAVIDHYTVIKGPVYIGKRSFIGAHSLVRNYVSLEESSVLGSGVEVKRSYIGPRVTIGSNCLVTDSILGENATFKPFVVTLNYDPHEAKRLGEFYIKRGVILGKGSLINGGSVLKPGTIIESRKIYP